MGEFVKRPELFDYEEFDRSTPKGFSKLGYYSQPDTSKNAKLDDVDKLLLSVYELANAGDWAQTQQIRRDPERRGEAEFPRGSAELIGRHPSRGNVNLLMGGQALAVPYAAKELPSGWRKALLGSLAAAKLLTIYNNQKSGLDIMR